MKRSSIIFLVVVFLLLVSIVLILLKGTGKEKSEKGILEEARLQVVVSEVVLGDIDDIISLTGFIEPVEQVNVITKIPGKLVRKVVEEGAIVGKEQVIAYVNRDEVGVNFAPFPVKSPIAGVLAKFMFDPGAMVSPQVPLATVVDIDTVVIKTSVVESDYAKVKKGQLASIYNEAYPDTRFEGEIYRISPTLDQFSHTADVEIRIPNKDHKLRPGMYVRIEIVSGKHTNVPIVPKSALTKRLGKDVAFVVNNEILEMRDVVLGYYDLERYEIIEGVKPGELVVVEDLPILKDGIKVSIARKN